MSETADGALQNQIAVAGMYENWFLEYASYVILERAVPAVEDGLKPVQRRILHALKEMDDGRFNKVANVIGQTMQYHPHGDASINDAIVNNCAGVNFSLGLLTPAFSTSDNPRLTISEMISETEVDESKLY